MTKNQSTFHALTAYPTQIKCRVKQWN